jgi:hypothetical protein
MATVCRCCRVPLPVETEDRWGTCTPCQPDTHTHSWSHPAEEWLPPAATARLHLPDLRRASW